MTFPVVELKFSAIKASPLGIDIRVRVSVVDDGGIDARGFQRYVRTLRVRSNFTMAARTTRAELLAYMQDRLQEWALSQGYNYPPDRRICAL